MHLAEILETKPENIHEILNFWCLLLSCSRSSSPSAAPKHWRNGPLAHLGGSRGAQGQKPVRHSRRTTNWKKNLTLYKQTKPKKHPKNTLVWHALGRESQENEAHLKTLRGNSLAEATSAPTSSPMPNAWWPSSKSSLGCWKIWKKGNGESFFLFGFCFGNL